MNIIQDMMNIEEMEEEQAIRKDVIAMVTKWSNHFGLPIHNKTFFPELAREDISMKLIEEELEELKEGLSNRNIKEVIDASGDLLWVVIRFMMEYGINPVKTIEAIYESNMSKLDTTEDNATLTYQKYRDEGITTYCKQVGKYYVTYRAEDHKVLKSHKWKEPDFSKLLS